MTVTSSSHAFNYDVFLSFRGTDTRYGFTGNLYKTLDDKGIRTFIDDQELQRGEEISPALVKAIHESMIAIIVLSEHYASSSFCLDELSTIIDCMTKGLLVIPVFYKVDPSDVRHHKGSFGDALAKHERRFPEDRLQKWKEAMRQVANLSGYHFEQGTEYEYKFIESIIDKVTEKINHPAHLRVGDYLVGVESRVKEVMKLLDVGSDDVVHMVGIHGMGGIGKSTLARAVYNKLIAHNFDGFCYLENMREESEKHGLKHLQNILLQEIIKDKNIKVTSVERGALMIQQRLQRKKVLLFLDDVDNLKQLEAIAGRPEWFGLGSRVIITTRDQQLLACHQVQRLYELKELNKKDALQLLTWKAFKKVKADPGYGYVLNRVVIYAAGLPLALEVIGSHLSGISVERWESAIDYYIRNSDKGIQGILEASFIALQDELKNIFIDIACFLKGYGLSEVEYILSALYDHEMKYPIELLVQKSLIKVDWFDRVEMHDLIQEMGRQIDLKKSHKKPEKRKRLWLPKDIIEVLKCNKGTSKIEIIYLDVPGSDREQIIEWDGNGFKEMQNLKILIIKNAKFSQGPKCFPYSLRVLEWWGYPSNCLPSEFEPHKFVMCYLPDGCLTSFELDRSSKMFQNLIVLKFDYCVSLKKIPDLSGFPNLEKLSFEGCDNLVTVHESIGRLGKVKEINALGCRNLVSFPPIHLTSLEQLHLSHTGLESFPEISGKMENIKELDLSVTGIKELPISFVNLVGLQGLFMKDNGSVVKLPSGILMMPKLTFFEASFEGGMRWVKQGEKQEAMTSMVSSSVYLSFCSLDDDFFSIGCTWFARVKYLDLSRNNFTFLPECIKEFQSLEHLDVHHCKHLQEIRGLPPNLGFLNVSDCTHLQEIRGVPPTIRYFDATDCESLSSTSKSMFINEELYEAGMVKCYLPGTWIPEWFDQKSKGASTCFWFRNKLPTNILCLLIAPESVFSRRTPDVFINGKKVKEYLFRRLPFATMDHTFICKLNLAECLSKVSLEKEWNHLEVKYQSTILTSDIKAMGIHVFKRPESREEDIRFSDPCRKRKLDHYLNSLRSDNNMFLKWCRFL